MNRKQSIAILAMLMICFTLAGCGFNYQWFMHASSGSPAAETEEPAAKVSKAKTGK